MADEPEVFEFLHDGPRTLRATELSLRRHVGWTGERFIESPLDVATEKWRTRLRNNGEHPPDHPFVCKLAKQ